MKKFYTLAVAALFTSAAFAQFSEAGNAVAKESKAFNVKHNNAKTPTDTAGWVPNPTKWLPGEFAVGGQVWNFGYTGGGYVYGVNISTSNLDEVAQGYQNLNTATFGVEGVLAGFIGKDAAGGGNSTITFNIYNMAANSGYSYDGTNWNQDVIGPNGSAIGTTTMPFSMADTTFFSLSYAAFPSVVSINGGDFAVSMNVAAVKAANDTVGLACDADGEGFRLAYHHVPAFSGFAVTDDAFGGLNNNIALFPVIDDNFVGIDDVDFLNGMQLSAYPNPVVDQTTISYNLNENMNNVKLIVYDMTGKEVHNVNYGNQAKGSYNVTIDASDFTSGNYFYSLIANGNRLTKRMVVTK